MKEGKVHATLKRLAHDLKEEEISYAIIGGMALNLLGYTRETTDVDILLTKEGLAKLKDRLVGRRYVLAFNGATKSFRDTQTQVKVEVITTGEYPGDGKPKPVVFPDPAEVSFDRDGYSVITLEKLIELKLASGISAAHRLRDLADVQDLIVIHKLPADFAARLDPSVRAKYHELWEGAQSAKSEIDS